MTTKKLYHYTSPAGLFGILKSRHLRATSAWHLDDGSECRHAINLFRNIAPDIAASELWRSVEDALLSQPRYIVCFSKKRDDPHQWLKYAEDGTGACIVFDPSRLRLPYPSGNFDCMECNYDENSQMQKLSSIAASMRAGNEDTINETQLLSDFWSCNIAFKRAQFAAENEVRYVFNCTKGGRAGPLPPEPEAQAIASEINRDVGNHAHPCGLFDEKSRPFEPLEIDKAYSEIILGPNCQISPAELKSFGMQSEISQSILRALTRKQPLIPEEVPQCTSL